MPKRPEIKTLTATAPQVLNAIRNSATENYKNLIPYASPDASSIKAIGSIMMQYAPLQNEFLSALVNRIGRVIITSKLYSNPWAFLKRGYLEFGETLEEIFVNLAKPFQFDPEVAEEKVFKREIPDVKAAFHIMNYQKFYKASIQNDQLRQAFLSWDGISDLIARIVDSMYTGANYDEFLTMKYTLARHILDGHIKPYAIDSVTAPNMKSIIAGVKGISNTLEFMSTDYNMAGVSTFTRKEDQYLFINAKFDALVDVEVLAAAFNMDKAEFMGRRILVDSFGALDNGRLALLFRDDPTYRPISGAELTLLDSIPAVLVDRNFLMMYDNFQDFAEIYNGEGLYWNYWFHVWKTFSVSPFHNALVFVEGTPSVTSVTVTPNSVSATAGQYVSFSASVVTNNFASKAVDWTTTAGAIDNSGNLFIPDDATGSITVTATSVFDPTKSGTATVTIS